MFSLLPLPHCRFLVFLIFVHIVTVTSDAGCMLEHPKRQVNVFLKILDHTESMYNVLFLPPFVFVFFLSIKLVWQNIQSRDLFTNRENASEFDNFGTQGLRKKHH